MRSQKARRTARLGLCPKLCLQRSKAFRTSRKHQMSSNELIWWLACWGNTRNCGEEGWGETGWKVVTGRKSYYYARLARFQNNIFFTYLPVPPTMSLPFLNSLSAAWCRWVVDGLKVKFEQFGLKFWQFGSSQIWCTSLVGVQHSFWMPASEIMWSIIALLQQPCVSPLFHLLIICPPYYYKNGWQSLPTWQEMLYGSHTIRSTQDRQKWTTLVP